MTLECRIKRWYYECDRRGVQLESILIHPDDYRRHRAALRFMPVRVLGLAPLQAPVC